MLFQSIQATARQTPDRVAMTWNGEHISYRAFLSRIQLARWRLMQTDLGGPGVALVSLARLDLTWPWVLALQSLGFTTLSCSASVASTLNIDRIAVQVGAVGGTASNAAATVAENEAVRILSSADVDGPELSDAARGGHLMLSSGTTGRPKLVYFDGSSEVSVARQIIDGMPFDERTSYFGGSFPLATAAGYRGPVRVWLAGGRLVLHQGPDPWAVFRTGGLTFGLLTPGMLQELLEQHPDQSSADPRLTLHIGGGQVPWDVVLDAQRRLTPNIYALYGSTEAGVLSVTPLQEASDTRLYRLDEARSLEIVDEAGRLLPQGAVGIVRTDTNGHVEGYWNDPVSTSAHFRDGWFYPGDLGRITADGRLELLGRADDVLVLGQDKRAAVDLERRVEHLVGHPGFCLIQAPGVDFNTVHLVFEGPAPLGEATEAAVRKALGARLKVAFVRLDRLPRNEMGKVVRRELRQALSSL